MNLRAASAVCRWMEWLGDIQWVGLTGENFSRIASSALLVGTVLAVTLLVRGALRMLRAGRFSSVTFWGRQLVSLAALAVIVFGLISIWFTRPESLTAILGMVSAGLAFALQRVITSFAGYFIILRGKNFQVGDRISMGGVRGDVVDVGFFQTTIMEMGQPRDEGNATWVRGRQFTGRIVTVANYRIFEEPIYNYTKDFPVLWEEITFHLPLGSDRAAAERIAVDSARKHADPRDLLTDDQRAHILDRFDVSLEALEPRLYYKLLARSVEATLRFVVSARHDREAKDAITRDMLDRFVASKVALGEG